MNSKIASLTLAAKQISIVSFLQRVGITPKRETAKFALYHAPYRTDRHPSMVVNKEKNRWADLAQNRNGDIIDLVKLMYNVNFNTAIEFIVMESPAFSNDNTVVPDEHDSITGVKVAKLTNAKLYSYLATRKIDLVVAMQYCVEVHYVHKSRRYFALGFENIKHAYETRNAYFKRCLGAKAISLIKQNDANSICLVFEGFMDFLSYVTLSKISPEKFPFSNDVDILVLNSVAMARTAIMDLHKYATVDCYLDNDDAGRQTVQMLMEVHNGARDKSHLYAGYKDLNDCLNGRRCCP
jgi:hypothetical protein